MGLYLLKPRLAFDACTNREQPDARFLERDTVQALVIRAESEREARETAMLSAGDECPWFHGPPGAGVESTWEDPGMARWTNDATWLRSDLVTCEEIGAEGEHGVVIRHFEPG